MDKIRVIRDMLLTTQNRQKSYVNHRRKPLEFHIGDHVLLFVTPWKGVFRFGKESLLQDILGPLKSFKRLER